MSVKTTIARPYAKAAFDFAVAANSTKEWSQLLNTLAWVVTQPKIQRVLQDPKFTETKRYEIIAKDICASILQKNSENFLKFLAKNNRLILLPEIAQLFDEYCTEEEKTTKATIISAAPLSPNEQERLRQALTTKLQRTVVLETKLDKNLLGGMVIRAGDLVIDNSVRGKLSRLASVLVN